MALATHSELVPIPIDSIQIEDLLEIPQDLLGVVLFEHGSGSSRLSLRNNYVAVVLREARLATLLLDLLAPQEDQDYQTRFDISLLTQRLHAAVKWLQQYGAASSLRIGLFGASTGAAAALQVATIAGLNALEKVTAQRC